MHHRIRSYALAGLAAFAAAACSSGSSSPSTPALSADLADSLGEAIVSDIGISTAGATTTGGSATFSASAGAELAGPALSPSICTVTRSPSSPANSDSDPVPDSVRVSFSGCVIDFPGESDTLTGTIDYIDPTPTVTDRAIKKVFTDYGWIMVRTVSGRVRSILMSGTRMAVRDSSTITQTDSNMTTTFTYANGNTATHDRTWSFLFTADTANSIKPDSALPPGTWNVSGNSTWTHKSLTFALALSTPVPVHFNPACAEQPRFDAGTTQIVVSRGGNTSTVTIQYTACGQYTVTRT
ncbi:MAG: hypothetical protein WBC97_08205 [Gemmatimonadales bacterium]